MRCSHTFAGIAPPLIRAEITDVPIVSSTFAIATRIATVADALESLAVSGHALVDHRILYRLDARDPAGLAALVRRLSDRRPDGALPLVSFEDHTPGQGQYADRAAFERYLSGTKKMTPDAARERVDALIAERAEFWTYRQRAIPWLTHAASGGEIRLMAHDPASAADIAEAAGWAAMFAGVGD